MRDITIVLLSQRNKGQIKMYLIISSRCKSLVFGWKINVRLKTFARERSLRRFETIFFTFSGR